MELRQAHPTPTDSAGSPSERAELLETSSLIEPDHAGAPDESTPENSEDWRAKLWATSRTMQWNWD